MSFFRAVGRHIEDKYGNVLDPRDRNVQLRAMKQLDAGDSNLNDELLKALKAPKETGNSTPRMAGDVFTKPAKESAVITQPTNNVTLLDDLRGVKPQINAGTVVHTMAGQLGVENQLLSDPKIIRAISDRYGFEFNPNQLIDYNTPEGRDLQHKGVDILVPQNSTIPQHRGRTIDFKGRTDSRNWRGGGRVYQDMPIELISQDYSGWDNRIFGSRNVPRTLGQLQAELDIRTKGKPGWSVDPTKITDTIIYSNPGAQRLSFIDGQAMRDRTNDLISEQFNTGNVFYPSFWNKNPNGRSYNTVNLAIDYDVLDRVLGDYVEHIPLN